MFEVRAGAGVCEASLLVSYGLAVLSRADSSMARVARCKDRGVTESL